MKIFKKNKLEHVILMTNISDLNSDALKQIGKAIDNILKIKRISNDLDSYVKQLETFDKVEPDLREISISGKFPDLNYNVWDQVKVFGQETPINLGYQRFKHSEVYRKK